jgi:hypothetical protein
VRRRCDTNSTVLLGLGAIAAAALAAMLVVVVRRRRTMPRLPNARRTRRLLRHRLGPRHAARALAAADAHLEALWPARPRFRDRALSEPTERIVIPALALYRGLRDEGVAEARALGLVEAALAGERRRRSRMLGLASRADAGRRPPPHAGTSWLFAPQGWDVEWIAEDDELVAFDVLRCFYVDAVGAYGSPELAPVFCALDDFSGDALGPGVAGIRASTIAFGGGRCEFRFRRTGVREASRSTSPPRVIRFPGQWVGH